MHDHGRSTVAALFFPLALVIASQGNSCRGGGGTATTNADAANRSPAEASAASGNRAAGNAAGGSMNQHSESNHRPADERGVAKGMWGGAHVRLEVTDDGARIEYDCGHGSIKEKMVLDPDGRFDVAGVHVNERGGPVRVDAKPDEHPARYTGRVEGQTMSLHVTLTDTKLDLGDFTLTHGRGARLVKCL